MWGLNPYSEGATREGSKFATKLLKPWDRIPAKFCYFSTQHISETLQFMGAGTGGAGWASAHPGKNQGGHGPPWKF